MEHNLNEAERYCSHCNKYFLLFTTLCPNCSRQLTTVISSQIDGTKLTGQKIIELIDTSIKK